MSNRKKPQKMNAIERKMEKLINSLQEAIAEENKQKILDIYDEYQVDYEIDESKVSQAIMDDFDALVDQANMILGV